MTTIPEQPTGPTTDPDPAGDPGIVAPGEDPGVTPDVEPEPLPEGEPVPPA